MTKNLSANVLAQQAAQTRRPVTLIIIELDTGTLRYAAAKTNFTFPIAGNVYTAKNLVCNAVQTTLEGQVVRINIQLDNTARDMAAYHASTPFKGRKIIEWKVYRDAIGAAADYEEVFQGLMEEPSFNYNWVIIPATSGIPLGRKYPL